jgi:hypothetical protein
VSHAETTCRPCKLPTHGFNEWVLVLYFICDARDHTQGTLHSAAPHGYHAAASEPPAARTGLAPPDPMEHFKAPDRTAGRTVQAGVKREEDEWGNGMLGDDLLPGM